MGSKPLSREAAHALLGDAARRRSEAIDALRRLPDDVDAELAADVVMGLAQQHVWHFARRARALPASVIAALLVRFGALRTPLAIFLREAVPATLPPDLAQRAWAAALQALLDLDVTYAWGSAQRRAKYAALAADPRALAAIQAVAVGCEEVSVSMLAVLATDASDASIDALLPHFARAAKERGRGLDLLEQLETHARPTPGMKAMLAEVRTMLAERNAVSPFIALARRIGLGDVPAFWFDAYFGSAATHEDAIPLVQAYVGLDSRRGDAFSVNLTRSRPGRGAHAATVFGSDALHRDDLGVGRCEADELPEFLARAASKLKTTWSIDPAGIRTNLRGKKRDRLVAWLAGG